LTVTALMICALKSRQLVKRLKRNFVHNVKGVNSDNRNVNACDYKTLPNIQKYFPLLLVLFDNVGDKQALFSNYEKNFRQLRYQNTTPTTHATYNFLFC
jgi:hypothetical protein